MESKKTITVYVSKTWKFEFDAEEFSATFNHLLTEPMNEFTLRTLAEMQAASVIEKSVLSGELTEPLIDTCFSTIEPIPETPVDE
jgi:hypothetical protein